MFGCSNIKFQVRVNFRESNTPLHFDVHLGFEKSHHLLLFGKRAGVIISSEVVAASSKFGILVAIKPLNAGDLISYLTKGLCKICSEASICNSNY